MASYIVRPGKVAGVVLNEIGQVPFPIGNYTRMKMIRHQDLRQHLHGMAPGCNANLCEANQIVTDTVKDYISVKGLLVTMVNRTGYKLSLHTYPGPLIALDKAKQNYAKNPQS